MKERVSFVKDFWDQTDFFFQAPESYDPVVVKKRWKEDSSSILLELKSELEKINDFSVSNTETEIKAWIERKGYNAGAVMSAFRLVIVGASRQGLTYSISSVGSARMRPLKGLKKELLLLENKDYEPSSARGLYRHAYS